MTFARGSTCCGFMSKGAASLILPYANWTAMLRDETSKIMRTITIIFGNVAVLALAGFTAKTICDTADCPASECP